MKCWMTNYKALKIIYKTVNISIVNYADADLIYLKQNSQTWQNIKYNFPLKAKYCYSLSSIHKWMRVTCI